MCLESPLLVMIDLWSKSQYNMIFGTITVLILKLSLPGQTPESSMFPHDDAKWYAFLSKGKIAPWIIWNFSGHFGECLTGKKDY